MMEISKKRPQICYFKNKLIDIITSNIGIFKNFKNFQISIIFENLKKT